MTVAELNEKMPEMYMSAELQSVNWANYTESDKSVLIKRAEDFLNSLLYEEDVDDIEGFAEAFDNAECAVIFDLLQMQTQGAERLNLMRQGVKSITTAGVSESYGDYAEAKANSGVSDSYKKYLWRYLFNGVR